MSSCESLGVCAHHCWVLGFKSGARICGICHVLSVVLRNGGESVAVGFSVSGVLQFHGLRERNYNDACTPQSSISSACLFLKFGFLEAHFLSSRCAHVFLSPLEVAELVVDDVQ